MKVVEVFKSIEGEGKRTGLPTTFIRLFGCNLRCKYCDTKYSYNNEASYYVRSIQQLVKQCIELGVPNVTITGGEPLLQQGIEELLIALVEQGFVVNVETNGSVELPTSELLDLYRMLGRVFFTVDYKCPSSGEEAKMNMSNFVVPGALRPSDVLKFVVSDRTDMEVALEVIDSLKSDPHIYFSPVHPNMDPQEMVAFILDNELYNVKAQVQLHKIIWDPDMRGV